MIFPAAGLSQRILLPSICFALTLLFIFLPATSIYSAPVTIDGLATLFQNVQNGGSSDISRPTRLILKAALDGESQTSLSVIKGSKTKSGVVTYVGVYGPAGNRLVRILLFADFSKWPQADVVGKLAKIKSWFFDYPDAISLGESMTSKFGGNGATSGDMKITFEHADNDYVAIFLSSQSKAPPPILREEVASSELDFYR